jgi:uncharacterized membrane protein
MSSRWMVKKMHLALWGSVLSYFIIFSLLGIWRHWGYLTSLYDLGCYDQAIWTASQGQPLLNSFNGSGHTMNWLGIHFEPILYIFVPLYKIYPSPHWLTLTQSAAIAFSSLPIFAIAQHITHSAKLAFVWVLIYLFNPFLISNATWDFHEVSLAVFFISIGLYAIIKKNLAMLVLSSIFLLLSKEHFGLTVAGLGFVYGIVHKNWIIGASFSIGGIFITALIVGAIMPSYSPTGHHPMIKPAVTMHPGTGRYNWLGDSLPSVIDNILTHPLEIMNVVFVQMKGWLYLNALLVPFLFLPISAPVWIMPISGDLLANLLSKMSMPRLIISYHSATIIPILIVASIHGFQKLSSRFKILKRDLFLGSLLSLNFIFAYYYFPLPLPGALNFWQPISTIGKFDNRELLVKKLLENRSISVQANLGPHFSQRFEIYNFPEKIGESDFIVLKLDSPTFNIKSIDEGELGSLARHLHMDLAEYLDQVEILLNNKNYEVFYWNDPWLVFGKGKTRLSSNYTEHINSKIQLLRSTWLAHK